MLSSEASPRKSAPIASVTSTLQLQIGEPAVREFRLRVRHRTARPLNAGVKHRDNLPLLDEITSINVHRLKKAADGTTDGNDRKRVNEAVQLASDGLSTTTPGKKTGGKP